MNEVRVDIRIKNNRLYRKINEHYPNCHKFAQVAHVNINFIYGLITLRLSPYSKKGIGLLGDRDFTFLPRAGQIAQLLECDPGWLFPAKLYEKHRPMRATFELPLSACLPALPRNETLQLPMEKLETSALVGEALQSLPTREREILSLRFGFGTLEPMTLKEVGRKMRLSGSRIREIEGNALRKLRHPDRHLKDLI